MPTDEQASEKSRPRLVAVQKDFDTAPNLFRVVSNIPVAVEAYRVFIEALGKGALAAPTLERVALVVA
jgi:hypothetical protein